MSRQFTVSTTPHLRDATSVRTIMYSVVVALMPAFAGAIYFFGFAALWITALCVIACVATEAIIQRLAGKPLTITDGSAVVTGILLAFNLPSGVPWWIPVAGSVFAIAVGKMTFGGLGNNPLNPALVGRIFLLVSWTGPLTTWVAPRGTIVDAETVATPLAVLKQNVGILLARDTNTVENVNQAMSVMSGLSDSYWDLFIGRVSGCIGETSALLLLIGAVYLLYKRYIDWRVPFPFIATVALLTWVFGGTEGFFTGPWLYHVLAGGLFLGAFFMATDMVTSPLTRLGKIMFGVGCGVITVVIRLWGGYPEGVSFAIVLMNLAVPLLDRATRPRVFGKVAK